MYLPVRTGLFDSVISIAVVHHFSTETLRVKALSEMHRVLRIGGRMLVYVWAYEQQEKVFKTQDVFVAWHLQDKYEKGEAPKEEITESQESG